MVPSYRFFLKSIVLFLSILFSWTSASEVQAQHVMLSRSTIGSSGGMLKSAQSNIVISHTVGQTSLINSATGGTVRVSQGFIQPYRLSFALPQEPAISWNPYPNPSRGEIRLLFTVFPDQPIQMRLYSMAGRLVRVIKNIRETDVLHLSSLPKGVYYATIQADNKNYQTQRIILK